MGIFQPNVTCVTYLSIKMKTVKISEKAANTINEASKERGLEIKVVPGQDIHTKCRHTFTNKEKY